MASPRTSCTSSQWTWLNGSPAINLRRTHNLDAPNGSSGSNSDDTLILEPLGSEPATRPEDRPDRIQAWIHDQVVAADRRGRS